LDQPCFTRPHNVDWLGHTGDTYLSIIVIKNPPEKRGPHRKLGESEC
jgi:hypothetical protein